MSDLELLGATVRERRQHLLGAHSTHTEQRERFLRAFRERNSARSVTHSRPSWPLAGLAALALAALGFLALGEFSTQPLSAHLPQEDRELAPGEPIKTTDIGAELRFSDGSELFIEKGSETRLVRLTERGAHLELTQGALRAHVVHQSRTEWTLAAGPYRVRVVGTRFRLSYSERPRRFGLSLEEGEVRISGGGLPAERRLLAGQSISLPDVSAASQAGKPGPAVSEPVGLARDRGSLAPALPATDATPALRPAVGQAPPARSGTRETATAVSETWLERAKSGDYSGAFVLAEAAGFEHLTQTSSAPNLLVLADVARFSGHVAEARSVLHSLRRRFAGSKEAATAAFQLGRLSGTSREAVNWFRNYLNEHPGGSLAREASGRVMELLSRLGDGVAAEREAQSYLKRYPSGPHAAFARSLVAR